MVQPWKITYEMETYNDWRNWRCNKTHMELGGSCHTSRCPKETDKRSRVRPLTRCRMKSKELPHCPESRHSWNESLLNFYL